MLKKELESLDEIPQELQDYYKKQDGKYILQIENTETKTRLNEFRQNNIQLLKQMDEMKKKYAGVDLSEYQTLKQRVQDINDQKLIEEGKIEELVTQRTERITKENDNQSKALKHALQQTKEEKEKITGQLSKVMIDGEISRAVNAIGAVRKGAMRDILSRGNLVWKLHEGQPVPVGQDGNIIYNQDDAQPITIQKWAGNLLSEAPFLFESSSGAGAGGSSMAGDSMAGSLISVQDLQEKELSGNLIEKLAKGQIQVKE